MGWKASVVFAVEEPGYFGGQAIGRDSSPNTMLRRHAVAALQVRCRDRN